VAKSQCGSALAASLLMPQNKRASSQVNWKAVLIERGSLLEWGFLLKQNALTGGALIRKAAPIGRMYAY